MSVYVAIRRPPPEVVVTWFVTGSRGALSRINHGNLDGRIIEIMIDSASLCSSSTLKLLIAERHR